MTCGWWQTHRPGRLGRADVLVGLMSALQDDAGVYFSRNTPTLQTKKHFVCLFTFAAMMPASPGNEALISMRCLPGYRTNKNVLIRAHGLFTL